MAVTMGLFSKGYVYGAKAYGYLSRVIGANNTAARRLASANKNIFEGSSVDLLKSLKREVSPRMWQRFLSEYSGLRNFGHLGIIEKENLAAQEFGSRFGAKTWNEYIQGLVNKGLLSKDSKYKDLAKAFMNE